VNDNDLSPEDVKRIIIRAGPNILEPLRYEAPENMLQAKFSLQFGLATLLLKRKAGLNEYTDDWVRDPELRSTMEKVKTILDDEISSMGVDKMRSNLEIELTNGEKIQRLVDTARGTPENPFSPWEIDRKFIDCAGFVLNNERTMEAIKTINSLERINSIKELTCLLV
jgi:2-methylcitrate dehydratase PrpD